MQATTLYVGKKIAPVDSDTLMSRGLQDAITPRFQDKLNLILPIAYISIVILGTFEAWYLGIVSVILVFVLSIFIKILFIPKKMAIYVKYILHDLQNRQADYAKSGDKLRAEAAEEMAERVFELLNNLDHNFLVPDISQTMKMSNGEY